MRLIILAVIIFLLAAVVRHFLTSPSKKESPRPIPRQGTMVRCEQCGLHVPAPEAFRDQDKFFCCNSHLEDYRRAHRD